MNSFFTSESVSSGHPDKVADQISDAILDAYLKKDSQAKVACETLCTQDLVVIAGEITSTATVDIESIVRQTIKRIGYTNASEGFNADTCQIINRLHAQSPDILQGVAQPNQGAGDQGIMFGYASKESANYIPATLALSHIILAELEAIRHGGTLMPYLRPDAKSQVTIEYAPNGKPLRIDTIVISTQHTDDVTVEQIKQDITAHLLPRVQAHDPNLAHLFNTNYHLLVNPTGRFVIGGPAADTGLTGRKIIVDTYGGKAPHGGGAFSGKDPSKVDRSAAYMARYIAKNLVAADIADEVLIQIAYAIGIAEPVSVKVDTCNTSKVNIPDAELSALVQDMFDLRPAAIIKQLQLTRPIYTATATGGHFGRTPQGDLFTWERLDQINLIKNTINSRL